MLGEHLSDYIVQDYLDGNINGAQLLAVDEHIAQCADCRAMVHQYKSLFEALGVESSEKLSRNFAQNVVQQTHKKQMGIVHFGLMQVFFVFAFFIVGINVMLYYNEGAPALDGLKESLQSTLQFVPALARVFQNLVKSTHVPSFIAVGLLAIFFILFLVDRFILQPKLKMVQ